MQLCWGMHRVIAIIVLLAAGGFAQSARRTKVEAPPPKVSVVPLPEFGGSHAIWGATGQDSRGHIWFGVTAGGPGTKSAHLFEYTPSSDAFVDRGNVVAQLAAAGLVREGEQQAKIHSKVVQGPNNFLYFASMDEDGEHEDGSQLPTWGGHLWRMSMATGRWEHLLRTREALIAVGGGGPFIYTLGYFGHVLYQYDTRSGRTARVEVGSVGGHISRNVLVDTRGHVYVPRLTALPAAPDVTRRVRVTLVEFGTDLREIQETPMENAQYLGATSPTESHGIVGLQTMPDGSIYFTTHPGALFHITPPPAGRGAAAVDGAAQIAALGWFHPDGPSYPASLFTSASGKTLSSLARVQSGRWDWVSCETEGPSCRVAPFQVGGLDEAALRSTLLYGSATRDATGGHYVVGVGHTYRPIALRVQGE